jgi:hypothetical protein
MHEVRDRSFSTFCSHLVSPILLAAVKPCPDHSTSVIATSTSLEERTETLLEDAAQTRLGLPWHHAPPFDLAHDIPRGILQLVVRQHQLPSHAHDYVTRFFVSESS